MRGPGDADSSPAATAVAGGKSWTATLHSGLATSRKPVGVPQELCCAVASLHKTSCLLGAF